MNNKFKKMEEHIFEAGLLKGLFGCQRKEVTGEWKQLPNEKLRNL
jgi:hypothetical protein